MTDSSERPPDSPWGEYEVGETPLSIPFGPVQFDLSAKAEELHVSWSHDAAQGQSRKATPDDQTPPDLLERWVLGDDRRVLFRPALPDRPLVVAPDVPFNLAPRTTARVYVRVPVVVQMEHTTEARTLLTEVASIVMSNTWWGDFVEGELCYWLPTTARRRIAPDHFLPHLVVCPMLIQNESEEVLRVEKSAVRVEYLSIFGSAGRLWADETLVRYFGQEEGSEISSPSTPPPEAANATLLAPPRNPTDHTLRARTFARLKSLSGL